jgi:hypothetical protein
VLGQSGRNAEALSEQSSALGGARDGGGHFRRAKRPGRLGEARCGTTGQVEEARPRLYEASPSSSPASLGDRQAEGYGAG